MYEELKMILELLGNLGAYAVWVAVAYFIFKLISLASYVLLAKYTITKLWEFFMKEKSKETICRLNFGEHTIDAANDGLITALLRLRKDSRYIHQSDIEWLNDAITEKKEREGK